MNNVEQAGSSAPTGMGADEQDYKNSVAYQLLLRFEYMRERIEHYTAVADHCPLPAFIASRDGQSIMYVNAAYYRMTGCRIEQLQNNDWLQIVHPDDRADTEAFWKAFTQSPVDDVPVSYTHRYINHSTGSIIPAITYVTAVKKNGLVGYVIPSDCVGMLLLGINLNCVGQQMRKHQHDEVAAKLWRNPTPTS